MALLKLAQPPLSGSEVRRLQRRLTALGYGLAALSKPIFPLAPSIAWVAAARFIDRVGKGIRGAPRDALIAAGFDPAGIVGRMARIFFLQVAGIGQDQPRQFHGRGSRPDRPAKTVLDEARQIAGVVQVRVRQHNPVDARGRHGQRAPIPQA